MSDPKNMVHVEVYLSAKTATVQARFKDCVATIKWPRYLEDQQVRWQLAAVIGVLPEVVNDCQRESLIRNEAKNLDNELDEFFKEDK